MTARWRQLVVCFLGTLLLAAFSRAADTDYKIDRDLLRKLADDRQAAAPFFVVFGERPDLRGAHYISDRGARGRFVVESLRDTAARSQQGVEGSLRGRGVRFSAFWVENKIYVPRGTLQLARALAQRPEVVAIIPEAIYTIPQPEVATESSTQSIEWNVSMIRADQVWPVTRGGGSVVANIDTGVQYDHPALVGEYRGNTGSGFAHAGNWYNPTTYCTPGVPCDNNGHGSHTMGTMAGDDGFGNQIGVAPGARWIACKGCEASSCSGSALTACAQWVLDPNGDGSGSGQPDVVNNSWGGGGGSSWYQSYVQNWRAAGIFPAFSNGNSGPNCGTAGSPGDYPESFSSGATNSSDVIASFSSRGPSSFGGIIKPDISAPGVSVRSSVPTNSYASYSGTSMASPHTAAAVALLWAAHPSYRGNISGTEQLLRSTAAILTTSETCGGVSAGASPNNTYGYGRLDIKAAVDGAGQPPNQPPTVTVTAPANGSSFNCPVTVTFTGSANDPEDGALTPSWSDNSVGFGSGSSIDRYFDCTQAGNHNIRASVTDSSGSTDSDTITITINDPSIPSTPGNLTATVSGNSVNLTWTDSQNESGYRLERKGKVKGGWGPWTVVPVSIGLDATTVTDSSLGRGNYQHRLYAVNGTKESSPAGPVSSRVR